MKAKNVFYVLLSIVFAQSAGLIGSLFTISAIPTWYMTLSKPWFSPPNWLFAPVWLSLYTLMGIAAFLVYTARTKKRERVVDHALRVYIVHLMLNAVWSILFFGIKRLDIALIEIGMLWLSIVVTIILFYRIRKVTLFLLLPYLAWVSFASILNASLYLLNR